MITEDYVSFEIAKLLKEKGFSENTEHEIWYVIKQFSTGVPWNSCTYKVGDITREYNNDCCIPMPTLQTAMKWLREVYDLFIEPRVGETDDKTWYDFDIIPINGRKINWNHYNNLPLVELNSYEEAVELALKYCLENLI